MGKAMEDITACASSKLKQRFGSSPAAIFAFCASLVRTNLECELVQRGGNLLQSTPHRYKPRNECIGNMVIILDYLLMWKTKQVLKNFNDDFCSL